MKASPLVPVLCLVAGVALGWVLHPSTAAREETEEARRAQAVEPRGAESAALLQRLGAIDARLARLEERAPPTAGPRATPLAPHDPTEPPWAAALRAELASLRDDLRRELELTRDLTGATDLTALMAEKPDTDWEALQALIDQWLGDPDAALRATRLLPQATLLRRFGPPTEMWGGNWIYGRAFDPETKSYATSVHFAIKDGRVDFVNVDP